MSEHRDLRATASSLLSWVFIGGIAIVLGSMLAFVMYRQGVGAEEREHQQAEIAALQSAVEEANKRLEEDGGQPVDVPDVSEPITGPRGAVGMTGARGPAGIPGIDGQDGEDGLDGADGAPGAPGERGAPGEPGEDGSPGADGTDGLDGPVGAAGQDGADGKDGAPGEKGEKGDRGEKGEKGDPGATGAPGPPGDLCSDGSDPIVYTVYVAPDGTGERWRSILACPAP